MKKRFIKFIFVGGLNTIVGYGSYTLFLFLKFNYIIANTLSTIIGIINSYIFNKNITFKDCKQVKNTPLKFIGVYIVNYIIGTFTLRFMVKNIGINNYLAGFINLFITTLISWFGHNYFSFKNNSVGSDLN